MSTPNEDIEPVLIDTNQAAAILNVSRRTIQGVMSNGGITYIKIGRSVRFHPEDITKYIDSCRIKTNDLEGGVS